MPPLFGHNLGGPPSAPDQLPAAASFHLDIMNHGPRGDESQRKGIAGPYFRLRSCFHFGPNSQAVGSQDVALLSVSIVDQRNARRAVGIVLNAGNHPGDGCFISLAVDDPKLALVTPTPMAYGYRSARVSACRVFQGSRSC